MADSPPPPRRTSSVISRYRATLASISARTGTGLPTLITSFAILHEATAIIPLVGVFYVCRTFGVGERVVNYAQERVKADEDGERMNIVKETTRRWMEDGEQWTQRVGRRYNLWGFNNADVRLVGNNPTIAGDVANALVAYCSTKALLPLRIGFSLYFSPAFARTLSRVFKK